jgi:hypothetical protein
VHTCAGKRPAVVLLGWAVLDANASAALGEAFVLIMCVCVGAESWMYVCVRVCVSAAGLPVPLPCSESAKDTMLAYLIHHLRLGVGIGSSGPMPLLLSLR